MKRKVERKKVRVWKRARGKRKDKKDRKAEKRVRKREIQINRHKKN